MKNVFTTCLIFLSLFISSKVFSQQNLALNDSKSALKTTTFKISGLNKDKVEVINKKLQLQFGVEVGFYCLSNGVLVVDLSNQLMPVTNDGLIKTMKPVTGDNILIENSSLDEAKQNCAP